MNKEDLENKDIDDTQNSAQQKDDSNQDNSNVNSGDEKINELVQEVEEQKNRYLMLMAEFQNYQKRIEGEKAMYGAMANMELIQDILEVFDDMNFAVNDNDLNLETSRTALKSAQDKLIASIERAGIEIIKVREGDEFNKEIMEAISTMPVQEDEKKGKVIAVINSAFKYKNREGILKAAKVIVGK